MTKIPLSVPLIDAQDIRYVKNSLKSGWVSTAGKDINKFELKIKKFTKSKYAVTCVNGTSGLNVSLLALVLKKQKKL